MPPLFTFASQLVPLSEALVVVPAHDANGAYTVEVHELDSFWKDGTRVLEGDAKKEGAAGGSGGASRLLAVFEVDVVDGRVRSVSRQKGGTERRTRPGLLEGLWSDITLHHASGSDSVSGGYEYAEGKIRGTLLTPEGGPPTLTFTWGQNNGRWGAARLELVDRDTLSGWWWYSESLGRGKSESSFEGVKGNDAHLWFLKRSTPPPPERDEEDGLEVVLRFERAKGWHKLWIPWEELEQEMRDALFGPRTRDAGSAYHLEIGLAVALKGGKDAPALDESWFAEVAVDIDDEVQRDLAKSILWSRGWLSGAGLLPESDELRAEIQELGRMLAPGSSAWHEDSAFREVWDEAVEDGAEAREDVRESLFTRFAMAGLLGTDENPFVKGTPTWYEFECYRTAGDFRRADLFVEAYEHGPGDERFPGQIWSFSEGPNPNAMALSPIKHASALYVPDHMGVVLFDAWHLRGARVELGAGLHDLTAIEWNDRARSYVVSLVKEPDPALEGDPHVRAFRRGRQFLRVASLAACASQGPSCLLYEQSYRVGIESQDVDDVFKKAQAATLKERQHALVLTIASLGYDMLSENPYDSQPKGSSERVEFDLFHKLACGADYAESLARGTELHKAFALGIEVGRRRAKSSVSALRRIADAARVDEAAAARHFEQGVATGKRTQQVFDVERWLGMRAPQALLGAAVNKIVEQTLKDPKQWGDWREGDALVYKHDWPELADARASAANEHIEPAVFRAIANQSLKQVFPKAQEAHDHFWRDFFFSTLLNTTEWAVSAACVVVEVGVVSPVCSIAGLKEVPISTAFVGWCNESFEQSAFRKVNAEMGGFALYGTACLGLASVYFSAGLGRCVGGVYKAFGATRKAGLGWGSFARMTAIGGADWSLGAVFRVLGGQVALGTTLGFIEEGVVAGLEGRKYKLSGALEKALVGTAMSLLFHGLGNSAAVFGKGAFARKLLLFPPALGIASAFVDYVDASGDPLREEQKKQARVALCQQVFMLVIAAGPAGIRQCVFRSVQSTRLGTRALEAHPKVEAFLKGDSPFTLTDEMAGTQIVASKFPHFDLAKPETVSAFLKGRAGWQKAQADIEAVIPRGADGKPVPGGRPFLEKAFDTFVRECADDPKRMRAFFDEAGSWENVQRHEALLPRSRSGGPRTAAEKHWLQVRARFAIEFAGEPGKLAPFLAECGASWRGVVRHCEGLPRNTNGSLTPDGEGAFGVILREWLVTNVKDKERLAEFFTSEATSFQKLLDLERFLPREKPAPKTAAAKDEDGAAGGHAHDEDLPPLEARSKEAWGEMLVAYLEKKTETDESAMKFYKDVTRWESLRDLEAHLPTVVEKGATVLSPGAKAAWEKVHQARTRFAERCYEKFVDAAEAEFGVTFHKPSGRAKPGESAAKLQEQYFIGTPPKDPGFKGVNSDLDFNLKLADAKGRSFGEQEVILIKAKRRLEELIQQEFADSNTSLDTNVYVRADAFPQESFSLNLRHQRERFFDVYKVRTGCEGKPGAANAVWDKTCALLRKGAKEGDAAASSKAGKESHVNERLLEAYIKEAEREYATYHEKVVAAEGELRRNAWREGLDDEVLRGMAKRKVARGYEDELLLFLETNKETLGLPTAAGAEASLARSPHERPKGCEGTRPEVFVERCREGERLRFEHMAMKQRYIAHLPETYMSKASITRVVEKLDVDALDRWHARVDQIRYLLVKFNHTSQKDPARRLWKLAKYEQRALWVDDLNIDKSATPLGDSARLFGQLKKAPTRTEAERILRESGGQADPAAFATKLIDEIRERLELSLERWASATEGLYSQKKDPDAAVAEAAAK